MSEPVWVDVRFEVQEPEPLRVDLFLTARLHRYSRAQVARLIDERRVLLRGAFVKAAARVRKGDLVVIRYPKQEEPECRHAEFEVLHEDDQLIAIDKPGDVLSHPTDRVVKNSVTSVLKRQLGVASCHLVHRLDRETSGVLLLAKTPDAAKFLVEEFTRRRVAKTYLAAVRGEFPFESREVDQPIGRENGEIKVRQCVRPEGAAAKTLFRRVAVSGGLSVVSAEPKTGRLHQIRVHLAWLGYPVLGDKLYHGDGAYYLKAVKRTLTEADYAELGARRQLLHAWRISFTHSNGKTMRIEAPPPDDFPKFQLKP